MEDTQVEITTEIRKYNASKHSVLRKTLLSYEVEDASLLRDDLVAELQPDGVLEEILIDKIVIARLRYERAVRAEMQQLNFIIDPPVFKEEYEKGAYIPPRDPMSLIGNPVMHLVQTGGSPHPMIKTEEIERIDKTFVRYMTNCERQFYRALHELQRIQAIRKGLKPTSLAVDFMNDNKMEE